MIEFLKNIYEQILDFLDDPMKRDGVLSIFNYLIILFMTITGVSALYLPKTEIIGFGILTITFCGFILYVATRIGTIMKDSDWVYNTLFFSIFAGFSMVATAITLVFLTFTSLRIKYYNKKGGNYKVPDAQAENVSIIKDLFIPIFIIFTILIIVIFTCKDILIKTFPGVNDYNQIMYLCMYLLSLCGFILAAILLSIAIKFQKSRRRIR